MKSEQKQNKFIDDGLGLVITNPLPDGSTETFKLAEEGIEPLSDSTPAAELDPEPRADESKPAAFEREPAGNGSGESGEY